MMSAVRFSLLSALILTLITAESRAASYGTVYIDNHTSQSVDIESDSWTDKNGKRILKTVTWTIKPKTRLRLSYNRRGVYASKFAYRIKTSSGTTPTNRKKVWVETYSKGLFLTVHVYDRDLPKRVTRRPVIAGKAAKGRRYLDNTHNIGGIMRFVHTFANLEQSTYLGTGGVNRNGRPRPGAFYLKYRHNWKSDLDGKRYSTTVYYFFNKDGSFDNMSVTSTAPVKPFAGSTLVIGIFTAAMRQNKNLSRAERRIVEQLTKNVDAKRMVEFLIKVDM